MSKLEILLLNSDRKSNRRSFFTLPISVMGIPSTPIAHKNKSHNLTCVYPYTFLFMLLAAKVRWTQKCNSDRMGARLLDRNDTVHYNDADQDADLRRQWVFMWLLPLGTIVIQFLSQELAHESFWAREATFKSSLTAQILFHHNYN